MIKIFKFLIIFIILSGCGIFKKTYSVLPDKSLNGNDSITIAKKTGLSEKERNKIASILEVDPKEIKNDKLYSLINEWLGVPYLYGGENKNGIDCSAMTKELIKKVYGVKLPRTSAEMFWSNKVNRFRKKKYLKEGDLVFFRINKDKTISHVGVYLQNNKFFSSNTSTGVSIEDLNSRYWSSVYVASGRIKSIKKEDNK